jgi:hypothetical protein
MLFEQLWKFTINTEIHIFINSLKGNTPENT